jgi:hypothetical protein
MQFGGGTMRRLIVLVALLSLVAAGCATADYQPYEGKNNLYEGEGGTKVIVSGIDFWANGMPPRKFTILGVVTSEIGSGYGDVDLIRSAVAAETRSRGGDAAIQINDNTSFAGIVRMLPGMYMGYGVKSMRFAVVKYVQ